MACVERVVLSALQVFLLLLLVLATLDLSYLLSTGW